MSTGAEGGNKKIKVAQNILKHILVLEFLKSNDFFSKWLTARAQVGVSGHKCV